MSPDVYSLPFLEGENISVILFLSVLLRMCFSICIGESMMENIDPIFPELMRKGKDIRIIAGGYFFQNDCPFDYDLDSMKMTNSSDDRQLP